MVVLLNLKTKQVISNYFFYSIARIELTHNADPLR
jgi:hypothetical protein